MIATNEDLQNLITRLDIETVIAVDTEADSLHSYFEKLCLIQIGYAGENVLVDPLAPGIDLAPLFHCLANKPIVFHGADYDVRLINRLHNFQPKNLFDTMIAARLCGFQELSLAALVEKYFGVVLSKGAQKANWAIRPLSSRMIDYAQNDTRYLLEIAKNIENELERLGRRSWFDESRDRMIKTARDIRPRDDTEAWKIRGYAALSPREQAVLRVLWQWRDGEASAWDHPAFHVMTNDALLEICRKAVAGETIQTQRMNVQRYNALHSAIKQALGIPSSEWPRRERTLRVRYTREQFNRLDKIRALRDKQAQALGLDPSLIASKSTMEAEAFNPTADALMQWQRNLLAEAL